MQSKSQTYTSTRKEKVHMEPRKFTSLDELPLVLRVEDLMPILSIGRNTAYELVRSGQIRSIKVGVQFRIPREAVAEFIAGSAA